MLRRLRNNWRDQLPNWLAMLLMAAWIALVAIAVIGTIVTIGTLILRQ